MTATPAAHAHALACARCRSPIEEGDLRCSICALATPLRASGHAAHAALARILRCDGCGAALAYSAETGAPRCVFCAAVMRVEEPADPLEVAEHILPFAVPPDGAKQALQRWLRSLGFFRPRDLASSATLENIRAIHWCCWLVDADAFVSWTADSNHGSGRSAWAPHAGQTAMRFDRLVVPASRGLTIDECAKLAGGYNLSALVPAGAHAHVAHGAHVEQFDVQRSAARPILIEAIEGTARARLVDGRIIPGTSFRNVRVAVLLRSLRTQRVALSAYVLAYRYKGQSYRAIVHGQDMRLTFGHAPYSIGKIVLVVAGVLLAIAIVIALIVALAG